MRANHSWCGNPARHSLWHLWQPLEVTLLRIIALIVGYFWPTTKADAECVARECKPCQFLAPMTHQSYELLTLITAPWPFPQWGLDLIGPMPRGKGQVEHAIVVVDYFTKWAEAEPLARITSTKSDIVRLEEHCLPFQGTNSHCNG